MLLKENIDEPDDVTIRFNKSNYR